MKRRDVIVGAVLVMASARFVAGDARQRLKTLAVFSPLDKASSALPRLHRITSSFPPLDADLITSSAGLGRGPQHAHRVFRLA